MNVLEFDDLKALSAHAAQMVKELALEAVEARGIFSLALAGGSTPRATYELLAGLDGMPWDKTHIFFTDERCVPHEDAASNYRMAKETLLSKVDIPEENVHPINIGGFSVGLDAAGHEQDIRNYFNNTGQDASGGYPLDCILLGMGEDGHTASLFPGEDALLAKRKMVQSVLGDWGQPPLPRVTMTLPLLNMARNVVFMIQGAKKRALLNEIAADAEAAAQKYPAAMVHPRGPVTWLAAK